MDRGRGASAAARTAEKPHPASKTASRHAKNFFMLHISSVFGCIQMQSIQAGWDIPAGRRVRKKGTAERDAITAYAKKRGGFQQKTPLSGRAF